MQSETARGTSDPFDTAGIRRRVLAAWAGSPARFREDANAEEDLVRGGYRDRLLVELAQNAADAAARAGVPGPAAAGAGRRTTLLRGQHRRAAGRRRRAGRWRRCAPRPSGTSRAASAGSASASPRSWPSATSRRSLSTSGGVRFSADGDPGARSPRVPALADELARRDGAVPVLRLPVAGRGHAAGGLRHRGGPAAAGRRASTWSAAALEALARRAAARAARPGRDRRRRRRRGAHAAAAPADGGVADHRRRRRRRPGSVARRVRGAGRRAARRPAGRGARPPRRGRSPGRCPLDDDGRPRPLPAAGRARADPERRAAVAARRG